MRVIISYCAAVLIAAALIGKYQHGVSFWETLLAPAALLAGVAEVRG